MDTVQSSTERLVEDVTDSCAAAQFRRFDVFGRALDGGAVGGSEFGDDLHRDNR